MSLTIQKPYLAGKAPYSFSIGSSAWKVLSREGNLYDTVAALLVAGDHHVGDLGKGAKAMEVLARTVTAAGADGSSLLLKFDTTAIPSGVGAADEVVSGSGQQVSTPGPFKILWVYQIAGTDTAKLEIRY